MHVDGSYFLSQTQTAETLGMHSFVISRFLESERVKALLGEDFKPHIFSIERDSQGRGGRGQAKLIPVRLAVKFWSSQAYKGNAKAQMLNDACVEETIERRADKLFGEEKSEDKRNLLLAERATWGDARGYCSSEVKRNLSECFI